MQQQNQNTAAGVGQLNLAQTLNSGAINNMIQSDHRNFLSILNQPEFSDITLMVEGKPIYCHQVILASRSVYFEASFSHEFTEKEQRVATYNDVPYDFFMMFLRHIYSDSVKVDTKYIYELLSVSFMSILISFLLARRQIQCKFLQEKM